MESINCDRATVGQDTIEVYQGTSTIEYSPFHGEERSCECRLTYPPVQYCNVSVNIESRHSTYIEFTYFFLLLYTRGRSDRFYLADKSEIGLRNKNIIWCIRIDCAI